MKVLVFGADSFYGLHCIDRFQREGHRVVGVYQTTKPLLRSKAPHSKYVCEDIETLEEVFRNERPNVVVYSKTSHVSCQSQLRKKVDELSVLSYLSSVYECEKFIYLSSIAVYGSDTDEESSVIHPKGIHAQAHAVCESTVLSFRSGERLSSVILRLCNASGYYESFGGRSAVYAMVCEAAEKHMITAGIDENHAVLYVGDAVDAIYRSISENAAGIYNITPNQKTPGEKIAEEIYNQLRLTPKATVRESAYIAKGSMAVPSNQKASHEIGFVCLGNLGKIVAECTAWHNKDTKKAPKEGKTRKKQSSLIITMESIIIFLILAAISFQIDSSSRALSISLFTIYILLSSIYGRINQGVLSASLVSLYNIVYAIMFGGFSITSAAYNLNILISVVSNFVIALSIGYVIEQKNSSLLEKEDSIERLTGETVYLKQVNRDLSDIKNENERKVLKYEEGFGGIYRAFKRLNSLSPNEVFLNSLVAVRDLIDEQDISLYLVQPQSGYLRLLNYIGQSPKRFPSAFRFEENEILHDVIKNNRFFANNFFNNELPSIIMPISVQSEVVAVIMLENIHFEKLNLYYINILKIAGNLLSDAYSNTRIYRKLSEQFAYEENSCVLKAEEFKKSIAVAKQASKESNFNFCVLTVAPQPKVPQDQTAKIVQNCIRGIDEIGRGENGDLQVILYSTTVQNSRFVIDRLQNIGIKSSIIEV